VCGEITLYNNDAEKYYVGKRVYSLYVEKSCVEKSLCTIDVYNKYV